MEKKDIISRFGANETDTGSPEVQIALFTNRINQISAHLQVHKKDFIAKRGLLIIIAQRNSLLRYLSKQSQERYLAICEKLSIRVKF